MNKLEKIDNYQSRRGEIILNLAGNITEMKVL